MAIRKVARMGHPVLRQVARPVTEKELGGPDIGFLVRDMIDTMDDYEGAGLAAPQVHDSRRVMLVRVSEDDEEDGRVLALINPEIRPIREARSEDWEGCLSIPDLRGRVPRWEAVAVDAVRVSGEAISFEAQGFAARAIQHEMDHLDGILFPDRMDDLGSLSFIEEYVRYSRDPSQEETDP